MDELRDKSFGATTEKMLELRGIVKQCRAACTAETPLEQKDE